MRSLILPPCCYAVGTMFAQLSLTLLAEATNIDPSILSIVGNGVTIVVLAWYVIYDVRTRTPNMQAAFQAEQNASRIEYGKIIEGMRTMYLAEQTSMRTAFQTEQAALREHYDNQLSELRQLLFESIQHMRKAVHDVRDTAQVALTKGELTKTEKRD